MPRRKRWSDLPPDLLRDIARSLHVATDFVCFHAVCKPWRSSHDSTSARKKTTDQFLPWLLSPNETYSELLPWLPSPKEACHESLKLRCVFSKSSYLGPAPPRAISGFGRNWVASADGTAVCYISSDSTDGITLYDPLAGKALTQLPRFVDGRWEEENPRGIIYKDGTVLLYTIRYGAMAVVKVAILRPCDDEWTVIQRTLESPNYREVGVAYHAGNILVTVERSLWHVVPLSKTLARASASDDVLVLRPSSMPPPHDGDFDEYSHVLESRGELLWVLLYLSLDVPDECRKRGYGGVAMVSVHALENALDPQWVRKEGHSLADRVVFLGWPNSFAVDAAQLGVAGGFVYFMYDVGNVTGGGYPTQTNPGRGVFKYDLVKNKTDLVELLPKGWNGAMCTWLIPQITIAPIRQGSATTPRRNKMV